MVKSILFVDDERPILNSIKRELMDTDYKTYFADSARQALEILHENKNINMVISDFMMPITDGYELLKKVKSLYPDTIRIILSGYVHKSSMLKCINESIAHIYINKPWEKEDFIKIIDNLFDVCNTFNNKDFKQIVGNAQNLPTLPPLFFSINKLIANAESSIDDIVNLINKDQAMAFKVLKTINSAFYGIKTGSIKTAVLNLGLANLKSIIAAVELFDFNSNNFYKKLLWEHSYFTNIITIQLYENIYNKKVPEQYSSAGLLHDIGKVLFLKLFHNKYENLLKMRGTKKNVNLLTYEKNIVKYTHEELGSYMLNWWQFPQPIVETALKHSNPLESKKLYRDIVCMVNLADYYSWKILNPKYASNVSHEVYKYLNITNSQCENIINHCKEGDYKL